MCFHPGMEALLFWRMRSNLPLMRMPAATSVIVACAVACAASIGLTRTGAVMIAVEKMTLGTPPNEFDFARTGQGGPGQWVVVADATAVRGRAIEQTSADTTGYRFPLAIYKPLSARNVDVALSFKPVGGESIRLVELRYVFAMPTIITSSAPMRSKTMFASTGWSGASGSSLRAPTLSHLK